MKTVHRLPGTGADLYGFEDFLDRRTSLEWKTFPEGFTSKKNASKSNNKPASIEMDEEFLEASILRSLNL